MKKITKGDIAHLRFAAKVTNPGYLRRLHENATLYGYSKDDDTVVFATSDNHFFTVDRGLLEEIMHDA